MAHQLALIASYQALGPAQDAMTLNRRGGIKQPGLDNEMIPLQDIQDSLARRYAGNVRPNRSYSVAHAITDASQEVGCHSLLEGPR